MRFLSGDARSKSARAGLKALLANLKELRTKTSQEQQEATADLGIQRPEVANAESTKKKRKLQKTDIEIVEIAAPPFGSRESEHRMSVLPSVDQRQLIWMEVKPSNIEYLIDALKDKEEEEEDEEEGDQQEAGGEEQAEQEEP